MEQSGARVRELIASLYDPATGMAKPALFFDRVEQALALARREHLRVAVAVIEFDPPMGVGSLDASLWLRHVRAFRDAVEAELRDSDLIGLLSERAVGLLFPSMDTDFLPMVLERVLVAGTLETEHEGMLISLNANVGVATNETSADCASIMQGAWDDLRRRTNPHAA